jgi:hypothetical protein
MWEIVFGRCRNQPVWHITSRFIKMKRRERQMKAQENPLLEAML